MKRRRAAMKLTVTERAEPSSADGRPADGGLSSRRRGCRTACRSPAATRPVGRPGGARGRDDARRLDLGRGRCRKPGRDEIEVTSEPLVSWAKRHRRAALAGDPRRGGAGGVAADRLPRAGDLGQRPARARGRRGAGADRRLHLGRSRSRCRWSSRSASSSSSRSGATSLIKDQLGSSLLFWLVEGILRTAIFIGYLVGDQPPARPAAGVRVPRRRAQDDLLLRGGRPADARARRASTRASTRAAGRASCWS